jgi:PPOX class probable F420-dependent enzyme
MEQIPQTHADILTGKNFAHIATHLKSGDIQVTPVWIDFDGTHVLVNTAEGRVKTRNMDRDPKVSFSVMDSENPYRYVQVRGTVVEKTREGADAHIDALAKRYLGLDSYPMRAPGEVRVIYKIRPQSVQTMG